MLGLAGRWARILVLLRGEAGESLTKTNVRAAAAAISRQSPLKMSLADEGDSLEVRLRLAADDDGCAAVAIRFAKNGRTLSGTARGRGELLLSWCFLALAKQMSCELDDPQSGRRVVRPDPAEVERKARRIVEEHEAEVLAERAEEGDDDEAEDDEEDHDGTVVELVAMMVEDGTIALAPSDSRARAQPRQAPVADGRSQRPLRGDPGRRRGR